MSTTNLPPADELAATRKLIKELQQREGELRTLLIDDPASRTGNQYLAEIHEWKQTRTDLKELKAMHPGIVEEYTFTTKVTRVELLAINEDGEIVSARGKS